MNKMRTRKQAQGGFTFLELMISTTVAVFLLGGLFATLQSTRDAYQQQSALAQLQDNQRLAMTLIAGVVESAGYFPAPQTNQSTDFLKATGGWAANQSVVGTVGDTFTVRYGAAAGDNVFDCRGAPNQDPLNATTMVNTFKIVKDGAGTSWLVCTTGGVDYQLVKDVTAISVMYGVHLGATTGSCTDTYQTPAQMVATPANWLQVCSIKVTLTFVNWVNAKGATPGPALNISRTIALMNTAGANT